MKIVKPLLFASLLFSGCASHQVETSGSVPNPLLAEKSRSLAQKVLSEAPREQLFKAPGLYFGWHTISTDSADYKFFAQDDTTDLLGVVIDYRTGPKAGTSYAVIDNGLNGTADVCVDSGSPSLQSQKTYEYVLNTFAGQ